VRRRGLVCSTALLLVCLELKSDSFSYRTQLHSIPKLQHYPAASQGFRSFWAARRTLPGYEGNSYDPQRPGVRRVRGPVCSIALLLVCLVWKSDSFSYRTHLPCDFKLATLPKLTLSSTSVYHPKRTSGELSVLAKLCEVTFACIRENTQ
jgi:hypothetical protein